MRSRHPIDFCTLFYSLMVEEWEKLPGYTGRGVLPAPKKTAVRTKSAGNEVFLTSLLAFIGGPRTIFHGSLYRGIQNICTNVKCEFFDAEGLNKDGIVV